VLAIVCNCGEDHYQAVDERIIEIRNDARPSNLDLSFTDLNVKLGGIPLALVRSYSSAEVGVGRTDFGPGWSLNFLRAGVKVNDFHRVTDSLDDPMARGTRVYVTLPDGSLQRFTFDPRLLEDAESPQYRPYFLPDDDVTSTLEFVGLDDSLVLLPFEHDATTPYQGPYAVANTNESFVPARTGTALLLRTQAGLEYYFDIATGALKAIQDDTGNRIEVSNSTDAQSGTTTTTIAASKGDQTVQIVRSAATGRVTKIIDPSGEDISYFYGDFDPSGQDRGDADYIQKNHVAPPTESNLGKVVSRDGTAVVYRYQEFHYLEDADPLPIVRYPHHLTAIYNQAQVLVLETDFDEFGRLLSLKDAGGHATGVVFEIKTDGNTYTTVQSDLGLPVQEVRNGRGDLLRRVQSLDNNQIRADQRFLVTVYRYDNMNRGWLMAESVPFVVTGADNIYTAEPDDNDPADWARRLSYDKRGRLLSTTDALERSTTYTYDSQNRLLTTTDGDGNTTYNVYDPYTGDLLETYLIENGGTAKLNHVRNEYVDGLPSRTVQVADDGTEIETSRATYDDYGRLKSSTASGVTTYYAYDENGNQTHEWHNWRDPSDEQHFVTLATVTTYDADDRPTGTAEYKIGFIALDESGRDEFAELEALLTLANRIATTVTHYNTLGQVDYTIDPFGVKTQSRYDARGNVIETCTQTEDEEGRAGWLIARTLYDAQGRVEFTADAYFILASAYDPDLPSASADFAASGTRNVYDALDRVISADRHQGVTLRLIADPEHAGLMTTALPADFTWGESTFRYRSQTFYDDFGRVKYSIDEHGIETHYLYDVLGRQIETRTQAEQWNGAENEYDLCWIVTRTVYDAAGRPFITSDPYVVPNATYVNADGSDVTGDILMPLGSGTKTIYDLQGRAIRTEHLEGLSITINNQTKEVSWQAAPVAWSSETVYNSLGQMIRSVGRHVEGAAGPATDYEYDARGRQTAEIGPVTTEILTSTTSRLVRHRSETHYNAFGQVDYTLDNIRVVVDAAGKVLSIDAGADRVHKTSYRYDAFGRTVRTTYADGSFTTQTFDDAGRLVAECTQAAAGTADGELVEKQYAYDRFGRLIRVTLPLAFDPATGAMRHPVYEYAYDARGNQTLIRDPLGRETRFTYDPEGRETSRTLPLGFGADGRHGTADDALVPQGDFTETFAYDKFGREVLAVSFEGTVTASEYDLETGLLVAKKFFDNLTAYDNGNGSPAEVWRFRYDAFGREIQAVQDYYGELGALTDQRVTATAYDADGRITQIASPEGTVNYEYDAVTGVRNRMFTTAAGDSVVLEDNRYTYDALGRLASVETLKANGSDTTLPVTAYYLYDLLGNLQAEWKSAVTVEYRYDRLNRLVSKIEFADGNENRRFDENDIYTADRVIDRYDYTLAADGSRRHVLETFRMPEPNGLPFLVHNTISWSYDDLGRLTDEVFDHYEEDLAPSLDQTEHFVYDLAGNRLGVTLTHNADGAAETTTSLFDANDRLLFESKDADNDGDADELTTYGYDHTQQTAKTEKNAVDVIQSQTAYAYDLQGRLKTVTVTTYANGSPNAVESSRYAYDVTGIRVSAIEAKDTNADGTADSVERTEYLNDPQNDTGYSQVVAETVSDSTGTPLRRLIYVLGLERLSQTTFGLQGCGPLYFGRDGHGSTRVLYDWLGNIVANNAGTPNDTSDDIPQIFAYDAYGNPLGFNPSQAFTHFLYNGESRDRTGLVYLRARYYNPLAGRFNSLDPFAGNINDPQSLHKYLFVHDNPVMRIDPTGCFISMTMGSFMTAMAAYNTASAAMNFLGGLMALSDAATAMGNGQFFTAGVKGMLAVVNFGFAAWDMFNAFACLMGIPPGAASGTVVSSTGEMMVAQATKYTVKELIKANWGLLTTSITTSLAGNAVGLLSMYAHYSGNGFPEGGSRISGQSNWTWKPPQEPSVVDNDLPKFGSGGDFKTYGKFMAYGKTAWLKSGIDGPGREVFGGMMNKLSEAAQAALSHVEGHAVAIMRKFGIKEASITINNPSGPCSRYCQKGVPELLTNDEKLWVNYPDGLGYFEKGRGWVEQIEF
jgi:RHS repeat-associated protein